MGNGSKVRGLWIHVLQKSADESKEPHFHAQSEEDEELQAFFVETAEEYACKFACKLWRTVYPYLLICHE